MILTPLRAAWTALALCWAASTVGAAPPHNLVLFVPDGLRAASVQPGTAPTFARLRDEGVNFVNSYSLFPTFTTANASAFATGHQLGDTGDFSNTLYAGFAVKAANDSLTPFLESDAVLREVNAHFNGNYLNEPSIVALARAAHYSSALIGKVGPIAIFDLASLDGLAGEPPSLIVDDSLGKPGAGALAPAWREVFERQGVALGVPSRGDNASLGNFETPGTLTPNTAQQQYFLEVVLKVVLPQFQQARRPFLLVYWSRDPDGTQHFQGDSFRRLEPGINGPTSLAALRAADGALAAIEARLKELDLFDTTNIVVAADHGFSTVYRSSRTSPAASRSYPDVVKGELPPGFLALDLASALQKTDASVRLFDPDNGNGPIELNGGVHPVRGDGLIGNDPQAPEVIVAANGGSDLVYLSDRLGAGETAELGHRLIEALLAEDYVSGLFVDENRLGKVAGALALKSINLAGSAVLPRPTLVVSFRSFATGCDQPTLCTVSVADTVLQEGQGMHGSFSRADTWNFMAARGPDFRSRFVSRTPASNADIGVTIAHLLGLGLTSRGTLTGRVLSESLAGAQRLPPPRVAAHTVSSNPAANGLVTILKTHSVDATVYLDAAGFPQRTVGLTEP